GWPRGGGGGHCGRGRAGGAGRGRDAAARRPGGNAVQRGRRTRTARRQRDGRAGVDPRTPRLREPAARRGRTAAGPVVRPRRSRRGFGARAPAGHGLLWRRARHASPHAHHGRRGRSLRVARPVGDHLNRQRISLDLRDVPLGEALSVIARRAGLRLTYSAAVVPLDTPVTLSASNLTVGAVLSAVLYDTGVDVLLTAHGQAALVKRGILDE